MEEQLNRGAEPSARENASNKETEPAEVPRVYVASLNDYNAGRLHGTWLDAARDCEDLMTGVEEMLADSPEPGAEEWAFHDFEGFAGLHLSEYEPLSLVSTIAIGITEHGPAFAAWANMIDKDVEELGKFEEVYRGDWPSLDEYVQELVEDMGVETELDRAVSSGLRPYVRVDYEALARDMELSGDIYVHEHEGGAYVFDATL